MNEATVSLLLALASFAIALTLGRFIGRRLKRREARQDEAKFAAQSRQVRRAHRRRTGKS